MRQIETRSDTPQKLLLFQKKNQPINSEHWKELHIQEKDLYIEIREILAYDQNGFCIYCERLLDPQDKIEHNRGHVEHFKPRHGFPKLTLTWSNLMISCNETNSCGHLKSQSYFPGLLNPYMDPIEKWLHFSSTTGEIIPSQEAPENRVEDIINTCLLLGLNEPRLKSKRKNLIKSFQKDLIACQSSPIALETFKQKVSEINSPFITARKQAIERLGL